MVPATLPTCNRTIHASVVAFDQVMTLNRIGTTRPGGMMFALERDVVPTDPTMRKPGEVSLRGDKRPRPIVLRANMGDCLEIKFQNFLSTVAEDQAMKPDLRVLQPVTRQASIHIAGMELRESILSDGTYVGASESSLVDPGGSRTYHLYAAKEGDYLLYSGTATYNGFGSEQLTMGLFGALNVESPNAEWYRSQVTREDLALAQKKDAAGMPMSTPDGHPIIDYDALYPADYDATHHSSLPVGPRACSPILKMIDVGRAPVSEGGKTSCQPAPGDAGKQLAIAHTDLTAIITGPHAGRFPDDQKGPEFTENPASPDRRQPFREVTIHYHESQDVVQPFPDFYNTNAYPAPDGGADAGPVPGFNLTPSYTLANGADGFAINYGVAGIGPEIMANRLEVGASKKCKECKFEEFFLNSWALGDPAMLVDKPANLPATVKTLLPMDLAAQNQQPVPDPPAPPPDPATRPTLVNFPDDPSNVYHSYLGDHVKFRILHAGAAVHHVHHHHAHQWLRSPDSDDGHYLDSQSIGPGASFSLELVHGGAGNRNLTPGDSIFHCHFYPHFAAGMWALFRVHDVFESGTDLDGAGRAKAGARALPDPEIANGTPIPALVPLPTIAMAPIPASFVFDEDKRVVLTGKGNPGFPFFVPGIPGHRPPHPPMDFAVDEKGQRLDGGLPRHVVLDAHISNEKHTYYDFTKDLSAITAMEIPEPGTLAEKAAMAAHATRNHPSFLPDGKAASFRMNGMPPQPGAPFADPGADDQGNPITKVRRYKGANIQVDAVFNKKGWHYPQQRMIALWGDVADTLDGKRPPQPLFFRANSGEVVEFWHANLVPAYYELDDFQVRTPTDILGQHIHLVKFDVLASDGAANGFNYEDGTYAPDEVRDRIFAIDAAGGLKPYQEPGKGGKHLGAGPGTQLKTKTIAELDPKGRWPGAQATVQRWYVDPLIDDEGHDRTITTIFTHDHFGPSTHQQAGLYGGLLAEPAGSTWTSLDGKEQFGKPVAGRIDDGGPTSYAANILTTPPSGSYREFAVAMQDMQLAYFQGSRAKVSPYRARCESNPSLKTCLVDPPDAAYQGWADAKNVINPGCMPNSTATETGTLPPTCVVDATKKSQVQQSQPQIISGFGNGIFSMNYRNEPLPLRVKPKEGAEVDAADPATDLSHAFSSIDRNDPAFQKQPVPGGVIAGSRKFPVRPISADMGPFDPYTPLFQAYAGDNVQVRVLAGGFTSMHDFTIHGVKWLAEPKSVDSGYRNSQFVVLSEHFELEFTVPPASPGLPSSDYLYSPSTSYEGLVNGIWGILRAYNGKQGQALRADLAALPNNASGSAPAGAEIKLPAGPLPGCNQGTPGLCQFKISAVSIAQALGTSEGLVYNGRGIMVKSSGAKSGYAPAAETPLVDPDAIIYVRDEDLDADGHLKPERRSSVEPLVLRAGAGDWIKVSLHNRLDGNENVFKMARCESAAKASVSFSNAYSNISLCASKSVGLHPQLVAFDVAVSSGINVGTNPSDTAAPGETKEFLWYAGDLSPMPDGKMRATPQELGAVNLMPSDPLVHFYHGLFGSLVIEPEGSTWIEDSDYRASATVFKRDGSLFRDFVLQATDDPAVQLEGQSLYAAGNPLSGVNYRSEAMLYRYGQRLSSAIAPQDPRDWRKLSAADEGVLAGPFWSNVDTHASFSNALVGGDPQTPIFRAPAGMPVRFRLLAAGGTGDNQQTFELAGHVWQDEPYTHGSTEIGYNPKASWTGTQGGYGPSSHYDVVIASAGGAFQVPGDYLYRSWAMEQYQAGLWGVFRVAPSTPGRPYPDTVAIDSVVADKGVFRVIGANTIVPASRTFAKQVTISVPGQAANAPAQSVAAAVDAQGRWSAELVGPVPPLFQVVSDGEGVAAYRTGNEATLLKSPGPTPIRKMTRPSRKHGRDRSAP
jgi:hypothetical protein